VVFGHSNKWSNKSVVIEVFKVAGSSDTLIKEK